MKEVTRMVCIRLRPSRRRPQPPRSHPLQVLKCVMAYPSPRPALLACLPRPNLQRNCAVRAGPDWRVLIISRQDKRRTSRSTAAPIQTLLIREIPHHNTKERQTSRDQR